MSKKIKTTAEEYCNHHRGLLFFVIFLIILFVVIVLGLKTYYSNSGFFNEKKYSSNISECQHELGKQRACCERLDSFLSESDTAEWLNSEVTRLQDELNDKIDFIKNNTVSRFAYLSSDPGVIPQDAFEGKDHLTREIVDDGLVLDREGEFCTFEMYKSTADFIVEYENESFGLAFDVPYNFFWGNEDFYISPYEEKIDRKEVEGNISEVHFGYMLNDGCRWNRQYILKVEDHDSVVNWIEKIEQMAGDNELTQNQEIINDMNVILYSYNGKNGESGAVIIGKKHDFVLKTYSVSVVDDFDAIEVIVKSVVIL